MPQHWVGRVVKAPLWLPVVLAVVAMGFVQPAEAARAALTAGVSTAAVGDGRARLSLPWTRGEVWRLTGGPHPELGGKKHPWSALDFQPKSGAPGKVRAARGGTVNRPCPNMVEIRHEGGWTTVYYHLRNIPVRDGEWVPRGAMLGWTSTRSGCGGYAVGPHLHFSLKWNGQFINLRGNAIGGWTIREGDVPYAGCLVRDGVRRCAPRGLLGNAGLIGAE
jgi:LasA protease